MTVLVLVQDAKALDSIQLRLNATGASKLIVAVPNIVVPKNMAEVVKFSEQVKPIAPYLKDFSSMFAALLEIE
jgi:hypothetical protein